MVKKSKTKSVQLSSGKDRIISIDPINIRFTHSKIKSVYSGCGRAIKDTIDAVRNGEISVDDIPLIAVMEIDNEFYSLNNRRLYTFKELRKSGHLIDNSIRARVKIASNKEKLRYTPDRCSYNASIMKERACPEERIEDDEGDVRVGIRVSDENGDSGSECDDT